MKKAFCLILSLLLALPLLAGCNDATFLTDPAGESESISASTPSVIEEESESPSPIPSPAPQKKSHALASALLSRASFARGGDLF